MSDRLAHRPRYHGLFNHVDSSQHLHKEFLRNRWAYRRQTPYYEKRTLGSSLSLVPIGYTFVRGLFSRYIS